MGKPRKRADWFPVYLDQRQYIEAVDNATAGRVLKAALTYLATGDLMQLPPVEAVLFIAFKGSVDDAVVRFQRKSKANAENAQRRWVQKLPLMRTAASRWKSGRWCRAPARQSTGPCSSETRRDRHRRRFTGCAWPVSCRASEIPACRYTAGPAPG